MLTAINARVLSRILFASLLTLSCSDESPGPRLPSKFGAGNAHGTTCLDLTAPTSWQGGIGTIFQNECGSCHPGSRPTDYNTFAGVSKNISVVLMRVDAGTMPVAGPLAAEDSSAIHAWVAAGMPEFDSSTPTDPGSAGGGGIGGSTNPATNCPSNTAQEPLPSPTFPADPGAPVTPPVLPPAPPTIPTLKPTYALGVQPIMAAYCAGCHSAAGGESPRLDTYASVKSNYNSVMQQVNSGGMPVPRTANSKLPADKIAILTEWGSTTNAPYGRFAP